MLTGRHALLGPGTDWSGYGTHPLRRARSEIAGDKKKDFNAVFKVENKTEFSTRMAKYVADFVRDGDSIEKAQFRQWKKYKPHQDWNTKASNLKDAGNSRLRKEVSQNQWDMAGDYNDTLPSGTGVPAIQTSDLASYRGRRLPPEENNVFCHAKGMSHTGHRHPGNRSPMQTGMGSQTTPSQEPKPFQLNFKPEPKTHTVGKAQPGAKEGVNFTNLVVTEQLPDHFESQRQKRMLQNHYDDYTWSIEFDKTTRVPAPARLNLTFHPVRPYQKMNRFDGSPCRQDEN